LRERSAPAKKRRSARTGDINIATRDRPRSNARVNIVETHELAKSFAAQPVLHGIDLRVAPGTLYGFLGPNGAGKTTTLRILLGLLDRSGGTARVLGCDPWRQGARARTNIGYLPGDVRWYPRLTGRATLDFLAGVRQRDCRRTIHRLARRLELDLNLPVRTYSRGMKQKLGIIQALMHEPALLILDEPATSLDPLMQDVLHDELRQAVAIGRTVLFSSHTLSEVQQLCDHVGILRAGRLIEQTTIDALRNRALRRVEITFAAGAAGMASAPRGWHGEKRGDHWVGSFSGPMSELLAWLAKQPVLDLVVTPPDLEDLFRAYYATPDAGASA